MVSGTVESGKPFVFDNGSKAATPEELIQWCEKNQQEGIRRLVAGDFATWLASLGRDDLVQVAVDALGHGRDEAEKLSLFVGFSKIAEYYRASLERRFTFVLVGR